MKPDIETLKPEFEHYVYKERHFMSMGSGITVVKLWHEFMETKGYYLARRRKH